MLELQKIGDLTRPTYKVDHPSTGPKWTSQFRNPYGTFMFTHDKTAKVYFNLVCKPTAPVVTYAKSP